MTCTVNAGAVPMNHWAQDPEVGGVRFIGEGCHWVDLLLFLAGSPIVGVQSVYVGPRPGLDTPTDKVTVSLRFADGSIGTVHYFANGHKSYSKERVEVFSDGRILVLDNFRRLTGYGFSGFRRMNLWRQDKGHRECITRFFAAVSDGGEPPLKREEIFNVTEACFDAVGI
jgi:predicted dehydrogenase